MVAITFESELDADFEDDKKTASASPQTMIDFYLKKAEEQKEKAKLNVLNIWSWCER